MGRAAAFKRTISTAVIAASGVTLAAGVAAASAWISSSTIEHAGRPAPTALPIMPTATSANVFAHLRGLCVEGAALIQPRIHTTAVDAATNVFPRNNA